MQCWDDERDGGKGLALYAADQSKQVVNKQEPKKVVPLRLMGAGVTWVTLTVLCSLYGHI